MRFYATITVATCLFLVTIVVKFEVFELNFIVGLNFINFIINNIKFIKSKMQILARRVGDLWPINILTENIVTILTILSVFR